jgi:hypothetical protein
LLRAVRASIVNKPAFQIYWKPVYLLFGIALLLTLDLRYFAGLARIGGVQRARRAPLWQIDYFGNKYAAFKQKPRKRKINFSQGHNMSKYVVAAG